MVQIILMNGPKGAGKRHHAEAFVDISDSARIMPIAHRLKLDALGAYHLLPSEAEYVGRYKDEPSKVLQGKTPREVYAEYKRRKREEEGEDVFARIWVRHATAYRGYKYLIVPDVMYQSEVEFISKAFGKVNTLLLRVSREGHDWTEGESCEHFLQADIKSDPASGLDSGVVVQQHVRELFL